MPSHWPPPRPKSSSSRPTSLWRPKHAATEADPVCYPSLPLAVPVPSATAAATAADYRGCLSAVSSLSTGPLKRRPGRLDSRVATAHAIHACEFCDPACSFSPCDPVEIFLPLLCPKPRIPTAGRAFVLCYLIDLCLTWSNTDGSRSLLML
jgi:hypothetical protein